MTEKILEMINTYLESLPEERRKYLDKNYTKSLKKLKKISDKSTQCTYLAQLYIGFLNDIIAKEEYISFANGKISIIPVRSTFDNTTIASFEVYLNGIIKCLEDLEEYPELRKQVLERLEVVFSQNLRKRQYKENIVLFKKIKTILLSKACKNAKIKAIQRIKKESSGNLTFPFDYIIDELNQYQTEMTIRRRAPFLIYSSNQKFVGQSKDYIGIYPFENFEPEYIIMLKNYILLDPERIFNSDCSEAYRQLENKAKRYIVYIGTLLENSKNIPQTINRINNENQELFCEARNNTSASSSKVPQHLKDFRELFIYNMIARRDPLGKGTYVNPSNIPELDMKKRPYDDLTEKQHQLQRQILERGLLGVLVKSIIQGIEEEIEIENNSPRQKVYSQCGS